MSYRYLGLIFTISLFISCASGTQYIGEDGWPIRNATKTFRCPAGTSLEDIKLSDGSRRVLCVKGNIPLARGFEIIWNPKGAIAYLYRTDDDGNPISKVGYHPNGSKSAEETFIEGRVVKSLSWFDNGDTKYEAISEGQGTAITQWDSRGNIEKKGFKKKGKREGKWQEFKNGAMEFVVYQDGQKEGPARREYMDGSVERGHFEKGNREGVWKRGIADRTEAVLHFKGGLLEGKSSYYYSTGQLKRAGEFHEGKKMGHWKTLFANGQIATSGDYFCGEKNGTWTRFHKEGKKKEEGQYFDDQKVGNWKFWNASGELLRVEEFPQIPTDQSKVEKTKTCLPSSAKHP